MTSITAKIKQFWLAHEVKIILAAGLILIAGVAFESGYLKGKTAVTNPIIIEKPAQGQNLSQESAQGGGLEAQKSAQEAEKAVSGSTAPAKTSAAGGTSCAYVGSKNSNKYHLPTCQWAKNIKPENIVCFSSAEDAQSRGYQAGCLK
jgi:hypothetical protein